MTAPKTVTGLEANVSRETWEALTQFDAIFMKWQASLNLVSKSSVPDRWTRHILDSAQVFYNCPLRNGIWLDIGSGGGFPGLICAILAREKAPDLTFRLVDSDQRKRVFLQEAARQLGLQVSFSAERIETLDPLAAQVLSARALAPLEQLCSFANRHLSRDGICLFQKGARYQEELETARRHWQMNVEIIPSTTAPNAVLLRTGRPTHAP